MCESFIANKGLQNVAGGMTAAGFYYYYCLSCEGRTRVRFLGHEAGVPVFESACKCGAVHTFKSIIGDIPKKEYVRDTGSAVAGKTEAVNPAKPDQKSVQKAKNDEVS